VTAAISKYFGLRIKECIEVEARRAYEIETGASSRKNCREEGWYSRKAKHLIALLKVMVSRRMVEISVLICGEKRDACKAVDAIYSEMAKYSRGSA
jgi:hypothetical protein